MIKKKDLKNPQWLRDIKSKKYSIFRLDILFSNKKYRDILFVNDGGWHFSYLKDAKGVEDKLKSIRHHVDYELNPVGIKKLETMIKDKKLVYNYKLDQRAEDAYVLGVDVKEVIKGTYDQDVTGAITVDGSTINLNNGTKGAARLDDTVDTGDDPAGISGSDGSNRIETSSKTVIIGD